MKSKLRLDQLLVERHGYETRSRARDAVLRGCIFIDGKLAIKPGHTLSVDANIQIKDDAAKYVSRAALKLLHALKVSEFDVRGKTALDLGASTGGFSQVLLESGARHGDLPFRGEGSRAKVALPASRPSAQRFPPGA